jgi:hypothetical protein
MQPLRPIQHVPLHHAPAGDACVLDNAPVAMLLAILAADFAAQEHDGRHIGILAAVRIDLVGTTADFPGFGPRPPLPTTVSRIVAQRCMAQSIAHGSIRKSDLVGEQEMPISKKPRSKTAFRDDS